MFKRALGWVYRTPSIDLETRKKERAAPAPVHREGLSKEGALFLTAVEGKVTLLHTAKRFPHIINKLAVFQHKPSTMIGAIDELLVVEETRKRVGFPFEVVVELTDLKAFCVRWLRGEQG